MKIFLIVVWAVRQRPRIIISLLYWADEAIFMDAEAHIMEAIIIIVCIVILVLIVWVVSVSKINPSVY